MDSRYRGGVMMPRMALTLAVFALLPCPARSCSLCSADALRRTTWRQESSKAHLVLIGTLSNPRLNTDGSGGTTDFRIESILKDHADRPKGQTLVLPRFVPVTSGEPVRYLLFCDMIAGKLDPYRSVLVTPAAVDYLKAAMGLDPKQRIQGLRFFARYFTCSDGEVAADAFLEWAKATDTEVSAAATALDGPLLRRLLTDPKTPRERIGLLAYLLGVCGTAEDAALLEEWLTRNDRERPWLSGLLAGYVRLQPQKGWRFAETVAVDPSRSIDQRLAVLATLRFYHNLRPEETKPLIQRCLKPMLQQGDLCDLVVEDLRRWQWWELTTDLLAQYGRKSHDAPIVRRAILRYAVSCPLPAARAFLAERERVEPRVVREVRESLTDELPPSRPVGEPG